MKKAKEYAKEYDDFCKIETDEEKIDKKLADICTLMILETNEIIKFRKVRKDSSLLSVVLEQERKWKAFCKQSVDKGININGFMEVIKRRIPTVTELLFQEKIKGMYNEVL